MKKKLLVISASNNKKGNSAIAAEWFVSGVDHEKYDVEWIYLYDTQINYFTNKNRKALPEIDPEDKELREIIEKIEATDEIVLTTPIWNFSVPAVLKNFIDRTMASGRIWSEEKQKKVPGWNGKTFYLIFTSGAPWYGLIFNRYAIGQIYWALQYFGASRKIVKLIFNCGNGSKCVIDQRSSLAKSLQKKGRKYFG